MAFVNHILYAFLRCKEVLRFDFMRIVMQGKIFISFTLLHWLPMRIKSLAVVFCLVINQIGKSSLHTVGNIAHK